MLLIFMMVNAEHLATKHFLNNGGIMALREVLLDELRDMYSAENQLIKAFQSWQKEPRTEISSNCSRAISKRRRGRFRGSRKSFKYLGRNRRVSIAAVWKAS
jgi:hypothetical protein